MTGRQSARSIQPRERVRIEGHRSIWDVFELRGVPRNPEREDDVNLSSSLERATESRLYGGQVERVSRGDRDLDECGLLTHAHDSGGWAAGPRAQFIELGEQGAPVASPDRPARNCFGDELHDS